MTQLMRPKRPTGQVLLVEAKMDEVKARDGQCCGWNTGTGSGCFTCVDCRLKGSEGTVASDQRR